MRRLITEVSWEEAHYPDGSLRPGFADIERPSGDDTGRDRTVEELEEEQLKATRPRYWADIHLAKALTAKIENWLNDGSRLPEEVWDHIAVLACRELAGEMGVSAQRVARASWEHGESSPVWYPMPWSLYPVKRKRKKAKRAKKS